MKIPALILRQLYSYGSLRNVPGAVRFAVKNRLSDVELQAIERLAIDGEEVDLESVEIAPSSGGRRSAASITAAAPLPFPLREGLEVTVAGAGPLTVGKHSLALTFSADPFGTLDVTVEDAIATERAERQVVPYVKEDNQSRGIVRKRQRYVKELSGTAPKHLFKYSIDPKTTAGNIENFTGVAQVPLGFAGPILIHGEHARGEFLVPLATTEGTLVASYNRGIKLMNLSGGVKCTVADDQMQRAPVFVFDDARAARDFRAWVEDHMEGIREAAEETSRIAKLLSIDTYLASKMTFLRFNFATGDAAGQNMVGRATFAACSWILDHRDDVRTFYLESNLATDKKGSQVNVMRTRGKRVTAEIVVPRDLMIQQLRVEPESLAYHHGVSNVGSFLSGANNNGLHSPNAITAMFIATGQDVANVAESSAGILYTELTAERDLYISLTIPSLIVATYGGGTGLGTQRECLEVLGCYGAGNVRKLAEIVAGVCLAGELSLGAAISSLDWVSSHEMYGRNR